MPITLQTSLNEGHLLEDLTPDERKVLGVRLRAYNTAMARALSPLFILFALLLLWIDMRRLAEGKFAESPIYTWLALGHCAYALACLPGMMMWLRGRIPRSLERAAIRLHVFGLTASLLILGFLGILERGSLVLVAIALLFGNLIYQVPLKLRLGFNAVALVGCAALLLDPAGDELGRLLRSTELLAIVFVCAVVGGLNSRQRVASVLAEHRLTQIANIDPLTGVASRRSIDEFIAKELASVPRGRRFSLIVVDVDHFKSVNDRFGHDTGDEVLRKVATTLQRASRLPDIVGRWGGEEFVVLCTDTDEAGARVVAERQAELLRGQQIPVVGRVTASFGVAQARPGDTPRQLFEHADKALYRAKQAGRDRVATAHRA